jgi:hypothetical protein
VQYFTYLSSAMSSRNPIARALYPLNVCHVGEAVAPFLRVKEKHRKNFVPLRNMSGRLKTLLKRITNDKREVFELYQMHAIMAA